MIEAHAMNRATGQVVVEGSGAAVPGLLIVLLAVDERAQCEAGLSRVGAVDRHAIRLGSVISDQHGSFELTYLDEAFLPYLTEDSHGRPHLRLLVLAPESPELDEEARTLLSSDLRAHAARQETFAIRLPLRALIDTGVMVDTAGPVERKRALLAENLATLRRAIREASAKLPPPPPSSERAAAVDAASPAAADPSARFAFSTGVMSLETTGNPSAAAVQVAFDKEKGEFTLAQDGGAAVPLTFVGATHIVDDQGPLTRAPGMRLVVDVARRELSLVLPSSSESLLAPEPASPLFAWYQQRSFEEGAP